MDDPFTTYSLFTITYSLFWRWGESNPRPKQLQPNLYARILPLISRGVCRQAGLSPSIHSVVRGRDARTGRFKPSPAELCRSGSAGVGRATCGQSIRPPCDNRSQLCFCRMINEANRHPRRAIRSPRIPSKPDHPHLLKTARMIPFLACAVKRGQMVISKPNGNI